MTNERRFYTYAYLREDGTPYYIGKGTGRRAFQKRGRKATPPPKERILFLKRNLTEEEAFKHEIYMIAIFGRKDIGTGILHNFTEGGEGASGAVTTEKQRETTRNRSIGNTYAKGRKPSPEHREKLRQAQLGRVKSDETRRKLSEALKGKKRGPRSEETKEKIRQSKLGKKRDPETIQKMSENRKGKGCYPCSEEKKKKISEAKKGKGQPWSDLRWERFRQRPKRKASPETREKIRQAALRQWERQKGGEG